MAPEVILFDLGGVLLPFDRERRVRAMSNRLGATPDAVRAFMALELHGRLDRGEADEGDLADALSDFAGRRVSPDEARALVLSVFETPNMALWALAASLAGRVRVGGFSDNPSFVRAVFPPGVSLDPMFWSSGLGLTKSEPEAFAAVADRLGVKPHAILFIDDAPANVALARSLGWDAVEFMSNVRLTEDLKARGLV